MKVGRIIATAVVGLLFFFFVAVDLVLFGVVELHSVAVTILPLVGFAVGGVLGYLTAAHMAAAGHVPAMAMASAVPPPAPVGYNTSPPPATAGFGPPPPPPPPSSSSPVG